VVRKPHQFSDVLTRKIKRASDVTKNELMREIIATCVANAIKFRYVLTDSWFASKENFEFIFKKDKHFISALKDNRLVALTEEDKKEGRIVRISQLELADKQAVRGWMKGFPHEVLFVRRIFTNKDDSIGFLNLVCSDLTCNGEQVAAIYQKRWKVEAFHQSLKSNAGLAKSPARNITTQNNHVFMSIYAVFKLEYLKKKTQDQSFCITNQAIHQGEPNGLCRAAKITDCVTSVSKGDFGTLNGRSAVGNRRKFWYHMRRTIVTANNAQIPANHFIIATA
jgi:hypothetical protein